MTDFELTPCFFHMKKGYKKGCPECFEINRAHHPDDCRCSFCDPDQGDVRAWGYDGDAL